MNPTGEIHEYHNESFTIISFNVAGVEFYECKFKSCNFSEHDMSNSKFFDCTFENCNLANSKLITARIRDCEFYACKLMGVCFNNDSLAFFANFHECDLRYVEFSGLKIKNILLDNCNCNGAKFMVCEMKDSKLNGCDFTEAVFNECDLRNAELLNAKNLIINPASNKIKDTKISLATAANIAGEFGFRVN